MRTSQLGQLEIASYEGICTQVYFDSEHVRTLGIGSTVTEIPNINDIPLAQVFQIPYLIDLFQQSLIRYETVVNNNLHVAIQQYQFDALVSLFYNVGVNWVGRSSIIRNINLNADTSVLVNDILMFNSPPEIRGRRRHEANLFDTGHYTSNGVITLTHTDGMGHEEGAKLFNIAPYFINAQPESVTQGLWDILRGLWR